MNKTLAGIVLTGALGLASCGAPDQQPQEKGSERTVRVGDCIHEDLPTTKVVFAPRLHSWNEYQFRIFDGDVCGSASQYGTVFCDFIGFNAQKEVTVPGFHYAWETADGGLLGNLGAMNYAFDRNGKLLTMPAHVLVNEGNGVIAHQTGACVSREPLDIRLIKAMVDIRNAQTNDEATSLASQLDRSASLWETVLIEDILRGKYELRDDGVYLVKEAKR